MDSPIRRLLSLVDIPCVDAWVAGHEVVVAVDMRTLKECPLDVFTNMVGASNHEPGCPTVVCGDLDIHCDLLACRDYRNGNPGTCVPFLPCRQSQRVRCIIGATREASAAFHVVRQVPIGAAFGAIPKVIRHTLLVV